MKFRFPRLFSTAVFVIAATVAPGQPAKGKVPADAMIVKDITPGVRGGRLLMGNAGDVKTFNPPLVDDTSSQKVMGFLFDALYGYDNFRQKDKSGLAKSWEYKAETREWVFHLREGLKWSDGQPLTSDDALFYTEVLADPKVPNSEWDYMKTAGKPFEFSAPDPLTFIAKIPEPDSFSILSLGMIKPMPRHKYGQALKDGKFAEILGTNTPAADFVCSGPFKLKEFKSGEKTVLERNPYYYEYDEKGTQLPYLNEIVILNIENFDALALRFTAGDLDFLEDILPNQIPQIQDNEEKGNYTLHEAGLRMGSTNFWFNLKEGGSYENAEGKRVRWEPEKPGEPPPPDIASRKYRPFVDLVKLKWFQNEDFRKACSMAANRDAIVKTLLYGEGAPVYGMEGESNKQWNNPNIPKFPYDLAKAGALLDKIGFKDKNGDGVRDDPDGNPIRFTIITNKENGIREKIGVMLKGDMKKLGFDVSAQTLDFNDIITRTGDSYEYEACLLGLGAGTPPHPSMGKNVWVTTGRMHQWNPNQKTPATPWEAEIDKLYGDLQRTFDEAGQKKIYDQMQVIWCEHQALIHLVTQKVYVAASNKLGNIKPTVLEPHLSHNVAEIYIKGK